MMFILNPCHDWLLAWSMVLGLPHQLKKQHIVVKCLDPHLHPPFTYHIPTVVDGCPFQSYAKNSR